MTYIDPASGATLHVHLASGETVEAQADDLALFGVFDSEAALARLDEHLTRVLTSAGVLPSGELTDSALAPLRYLVEAAIRRPHVLRHPSLTSVNKAVVAIERGALTPA